MQATEEKKQTDSVSAKREESLVAAMDMYGGFLFRYLESLTRDTHWAEDLNQSLWTHVYQRFRLNQFKSLPLLKNKAYQLFIDDTRRKKVRGFVHTTDELPESDGSHKYREAGTDAEEAALQKRFWAMFPGLEINEKHKKAFWLKERLGYELKEISSQLNTSTSTTHDWINRVKQQCADYLNQEESK